MDNEKVKQFIINQRQNGVPDDQIYSFLVEKGAISPIKSQPEPSKKPATEKILDFTGGKELAQGVGQALANSDVRAPGSELPNPFTGKVSQPISQGNISRVNDTLAIQNQVQQNILAAIKDARAKGEDTTRLQELLAKQTEDINRTAAGSEKVFNPNELTEKQVIGDALQLGTTLASVGQIPEVAKAATSTPGVLAGALQGAKTGAISGGVFGGATGVAQGLQEDKTIGGALKQGLGSAIDGALTGGVIGGATGAISGGINKVKLDKANRHLDALTPKVENLSTKQYEELVNAGKIAPKTATKPAQYILSDAERATAEKYKPLLQSKDPVKNVTNVIDEIKKQDADVGKFLKKNNGIFNDGELKNKILADIADITDITVDDARLTQKKQLMVDNFLKSLDKNDMESLWQARKKFDKQIEKAFSGSPSLQKTLKVEFRNSIQDFIAERTPDTVYKDAMREMSKLFNLKDTLLTKASSERKLSGVLKWAKDHENELKVFGGLSAGAGILGTGIGVAKAVSK